ncbi:MAG: preprotein translocase subunit SecA [Gemmatimonadota bacterium]|nr:preprotein translocase subunit SecA [Gemmatimonadota bacterium]
MMGVIKKVFGTKYDRDLKKLWPTVDRINGLCESFASRSEADLRGKTAEFRQVLRDATAEYTEQLNGMREEMKSEEEMDRSSMLDEISELEVEIREIEAEALEEILPEAYAVYKETCRRFKTARKQWERAGESIEWDMVPYDVQLLGGIVLHQGKIAEMATGEGKTLVAGMPLYLNGLTGRGVHLVTVNSYLAKRDAMWLGPVYLFLGMSVGIIQDRSMEAEAYLLEEDGEGGYRLRECDHQEAYRADIIYGTKDQFGFDYLYDNMAVRPDDLMQREHCFAIIDEADSILIDEARTPLIISGAVAEADNQRYDEMRPLVERLVRAQTRVVTGTLNEAEELLDKDEYEAGIRLLQVQRGMPKNRRFMKSLQEEGTKRLIGRVEADYLRDKRMAEIDEDLYFSVDEKSHVIDLTDKGRVEISRRPDDFVLQDLDEVLHEIEADDALAPDEKARAQDDAYQEYARKSEAIHSVQQLLVAYTLYEKDVRYIVDGGQVIIVDEFTGRPQPGRRFADGLHQALEAKERVKVERDTQTIATITLQNYFRLYHKLAGMTGTAETEAAELFQIYKLDVVVMPTNEPVRRVDSEDLIFRTKREKYNAIVDEIERLNEKRLPVLVGTISVEVSELLSRMLKRKGIRHAVLNARHNQQEAQIVARAGQPGAVTIATNMAGRGTDIKLGDGVVKAPQDHECALIPGADGDRPRCPHLEEYRCAEEVPCGLHIIGTERHEARRIDRQLRGRAGRQGDPGNSRFFISLEDDLMRLFGSERIARIMDRLGAEEGEVIEHRMVTRSIERAQKRVEARNFEVRKHLLEYDDVMNQQREVVYDRRRHALEQHNIYEQIEEEMEELVNASFQSHLPEEGTQEDWNLDGLYRDLRQIFLQVPEVPPESLPELKEDGFRDELFDGIRSAYRRRESLIGAARMREIERMVYLGVTDEKWKDHLREMDDLKEGIGLRGYGQKDPLIEYKREGFQMFVDLLDEINRETLKTLFRIPVEEDLYSPRGRQPQRVSLTHQDATGMGFAPGVEASPTLDTVAATSEGGPPRKRPVRVQKVGRNEPCPCGSGKKYKKCHGQAGRVPA